MLRLTLAGGLALALSCSKSSPQQAPAPETDDTSKAASPAQTTSRDASPPQLRVADLPALDLPPLTTVPVARKQAREARELNKKALAVHRSGDYAAAEKLYRETLTADPGHVLARYNLACVFNMSGQSAKGLAILLQFKDVGCADCLGRLVRATKDKEWQSQWGKPAFVELTGNVTVERPDLEKSARLVIAAIDSGKVDKIKHLLPARAPVTSIYGSTLCDQDDCSSKRSYRGAKALAGMFRIYKERSDDHPDGLLRTEFDSLECEDNCCSLETEEGRPASHTYSDLEQVCFRVDSGGVFTLSEIHTSGD